MPHHKSCKKRVVTSKIAQVRNKANKSRINTATKNLMSSTKENVQENLKVAYSVVDKAAKSGVLHKNNASNKKSKLAKIADKISA